MKRAAALPVGVVGVGSLGYHHARLLREVAGAELIGVHDADPARASAVAAELGVRAFPAVDDLFGRVRAVVIAVPTTEHARVATAAAQRGLHILVEKPLASTLEEADAILMEAAAAGVLVATGHVERFNPAVRACEPYLDAPRFIETHRLAPFGPRGTDVAVVLDLMIHDIDLVLALAAAPVAQIDAVGVPVLTSSVDIANARMRFGDGAVANITASRVSRERVRKLRIFQPSGYLSLDLASGTGEFLRLRAGAALGEPGEGVPQLEQLLERVELRGDGTEPLRAELESFVAAVRGEGELVVSGEDGRRALAAALEIVGRIQHGLVAPQPA